MKIWSYFLPHIRAVSNFIESRPESVKLVLAIFGSIYILWLYFGAINEAKINRTIEYANRFESGSVLEIRSEIDSFWMEDGNWQLLKSARDNGNYEELFQHAKEKIKKDQKLRKDLFQVLDFYRSISSCALQGQCDIATTCKMFGDRMKDFRILYDVYFEEVSNLFQSNLLEPLQDVDAICIRKGLVGDW